MARRWIYGFLLLVCAGAEFGLVGSWLWAISGRPLWLTSGLPFAWPVDWPVLLGLHAGWVLAGALCVRGLYLDRRGTSLALVSMLMGLFFPVLGLLGMALIAFLQPGLARRAGLVAQLKHNISIQSDQSKDKVKVQDVVEYLADQVNVAPLADLVHSEDPGMRRGAIAALAKIKNPTAVKLLKEARSDPSPEMRVHAHVALTRLDNEMGDKLSSAMHAVELAPDDTEALENQARAAMDYLMSGLLEEAAMDHYVGLATQPLSRVLASDPQNPEALLMFGRLRLIGKDHLGARRYFEAYLKHHGPCAEAYLGLAEALFLLGEYGDIPQAAEDYRREAGQEKPDRQALAATELWVA